MYPPFDWLLVLDLLRLMCRDRHVELAREVDLRSWCSTIKRPYSHVVYTIRIELFSFYPPRLSFILPTSFYSRFFLFLIMRKCCCRRCHCSRYIGKRKARHHLLPKTTIKLFEFSPPVHSYTYPLLSQTPFASSYWNVSSREMVIQTLWWIWLDDERFSSVSATESVEHFQYMFSHLQDGKKSIGCVDSVCVAFLVIDLLKARAFIGREKWNPSTKKLWSVWCKINVFILLFRRL